MPFDRDFIIPPDPDDRFEQKLIVREKRIVRRMYQRYGDQGFVLNHRSNYMAFRIIKGVGHTISVALAFIFVYNLLLSTFTSFSIKDFIKFQSIGYAQMILGVWLLGISLLLYSSIEYLKSVSIRVACKGYFKPKIDGKKYRLGWIGLTLVLLMGSIFASYKGGEITPTLFSKENAHAQTIESDAQIDRYQAQITELIEERRQLTNGELGYRYGWREQGAKNFTLNSRGQRKLDQIDEQLQGLRKHLLDMESIMKTQQTQMTQMHSDTLNLHGRYLAFISLLMEMLIVISGGWLVWYGVRVEKLLSSQASKREYPNLQTLRNQQRISHLLLASQNGQEHSSAQIHEDAQEIYTIVQESAKEKSLLRKEMIRAIYSKLKESGIRPTWRNIMEALPVESREDFSEYVVRRYLTEIRKEEK